MSPLGCGTLVNYEAAEKGQTSLKRYEHKWGLPEAFVASFFDEDMLSTVCAEVGIGDDYTRFERMAIVVTAKALAETDIDAASSDTMFILASTKGNVHLLSSDTECDVERLSLSSVAKEMSVDDHYEAICKMVRMFVFADMLYGAAIDFKAFLVKYHIVDIPIASLAEDVAKKCRNITPYWDIFRHFSKEFAQTY